MVEIIDSVFEKNQDLFIGRFNEIKDYVAKFYEKIFTTKNLLKIERIDASDHLKNVGFRKSLSSWQNSYKNLIVSSCIIERGVEKRYDYKFFFTDEKLASDIVERIEKDIQLAQNMGKENQFSEAIMIIDALIEQILDKNDLYYNKRLGKIKSELLNSESHYRKISDNIDELIREFENDIVSKDLKKALEKYRKIFDLSRSINRMDIKKTQSTVFNKLEKLIFDYLSELITKIRSLVSKGLNSIKERNIDESLSFFKEIPPEIIDFYKRVYSPFIAS
ncbi:MAG: hypothetical protein JW891_12390 [Candidatus Lokiarchaeota archaeon]|nr:hypothetical protein [Candidatus Lokiarchaeota archaeon]